MPTTSPPRTGVRRTGHVLERHLPCMGGNAHVIAVAAEIDTARTALATAAARLEQLEARWSRFRPDSEISRLARAAGRPLPVSADTRSLVRWCVTAWQRSGGRFDASVGAGLVQLGYDRTFSEIGSAPFSGRDTGPDSHPSIATTGATTRPAPGCGGIVIDEEAGTVALPAGVLLDPGGIGKGLAADLVTADMLAAGAGGAGVNLAGDVRVRGVGPDPDAGWVVAVEHPLKADEALASLPLPPTGGAVASSSVLLKRWGAGRHHIIDPERGRPADSDVVAVTVVAEEGAWADAATKIALVDPDPAAALAVLNRLDVAAVLVLHDGTVLTSAALTLSPPRPGERTGR